MHDYDVAVIGSGAGGLAAAVALAQSGLRTLVLEQHDVPGGWCHSFALDGHRFSPGVHYLGELGPGGRLRSIYEGLGVSRDLVFCELNPDGFDHVRIGAPGAEVRFDIPKGREELTRRLCDRFPAENAGIRAYMATVAHLAEDLSGVLDVTSLRDVLMLPLHSRALARWGLRSSAAMLDAHVHAPLLRAILLAQSGDHGLPPSRAPAPVHASIMAHYFEGAWYPRGGGFALPRAFVRALERSGGEIRLATRVDRILMQKGHVIGLCLGDGTEVRTRFVVSNADPGQTFGRLLRADDVPTQVRAKLARTRWSVSALSLYVATDMDLGAAGMDSGNVWSYAHPDLEAIYGENLGADVDDVPGLFVAASTLKDPSMSPKGHTLEAFTFVGHDAFSEWATSRFGERPLAYAQKKAELTERMLRAVDRVVPGIYGKATLHELATPLTNVHYLRATEGSLYGTEKTRWQVGPWSWPVKSALPGLYLCGASTVSHGVMGATVSGLLAAGAILGVSVPELLRQNGPQLVTVPSEHPELWPAELRPTPPQPRKRPVPGAWAL